MIFTHYIVLQRAESEEHDDGVYLEIDDQINSGYNLVQSASCENAVLTLKIEPCFQRLASPSDVVVRFQENDETRARIDLGTRKILQDLLR